MVSIEGGRTLVVVAGRAGTGRRRLDLAGVALGGGGVVAGAMALFEGLWFGWTLGTWLGLVCAPVLLDGFWHYQRYLLEAGRETFLPHSLLQKGLH